MLEGRDKSLICQAGGIPAPEISWTLDDRQLLSEAGQLELSDVSRNQEGTYVCIAENKYGVTQQEVQLQVIRINEINGNLSYYLLSFD